MTYEEFLSWDSCDEQHYEWVCGEAIPKEPISGEHNDLGIFLLCTVGAFVECHPSGVIRYAPFQMKTGPDLPGRSPDLLFVANAHRDRLRKHYVDGPADLAVEIISPRESHARSHREVCRV